MPIKKEPLIQKCFQCGEKISVKFVPPRKEYAKKNNWGYWTEKEENKENYICRLCIRKRYYRDFLKFRQEVSPKKRHIVAVYLSTENLHNTKIF